MNLKDLEELEEVKKKVINWLTTENITSFVFIADIDDLDKGQRLSSMVQDHFAPSTKEAIGLLELAKYRLLKQLLRNEEQE